MPASRPKITRARRIPDGNAHAPTDEQRVKVKLLSAFGVNHDMLADEIDISRNTLEKHYAFELKHGKSEANAKVAQTLFKKATSDGHQSVAAAIFWLKTQGGWKETTISEIHTSYVARIPAPAKTDKAWLEKHVQSGKLTPLPNENGKTH
jgi:hypothetical protein